MRAPTTSATGKRDWQALIDRVHEALAPRLGTGRVADYIPALADADPEAFAMAVHTVDGRAARTGRAHDPFSIQSISKVFTLTLALEAVGADLWQWVGREPSGDPFNSIVQLEQESGRPRNPFINAGALVLADILLRYAPPVGAVDHFLGFVRAAADSDRPEINPRVAASESRTGHRNASLAHFMKDYGILANHVDAVLEAYFQHCALSMSVDNLARAGLYLANGGSDPLTGRTITNDDRAARLNAVMLTCGHYDMSGDFAFRVGLPGKSGVGGGILAVVPGRASIAVWSPPLNAAGNSLVGTEALEMLSDLAGLSIFRPAPGPTVASR